jgi:hypothetical protein
MKNRIQQPPTESSQAIAEALEREISPEQIAAALTDALTATTTSRNGILEVDYRTRLQAASMVLAYQVGRPREAPEATAKPKESSSEEAFKANLRRSPALRASIQALLDEAERSATSPPE